MESFEISTTVEPQGFVRIGGVPFAPGTEVEVTINAKRKSPAEFNDMWARVCAELRNSPVADTITDDVIQQEIDGYRSRQ